MNLTEEEQYQMYLDLNAPSQYKLVPYLRKEKSPFVIICPGGGYEMIASGIEGMPYAKRLNDLGYSAFVLYYHTKEKALAPQPLDDLARALKYIIANHQELNVEIENYSLWGSSAGGHLAASFATKVLGYARYDLPKPKVLVLSYPVISLDKSIGHEGSRQCLLGKDQTPKLIETFSIENQIDEDYPPTFIWDSTKDETVPLENSHLFFKQLCDYDVKSCYLQFSHGEHGSGLARGEFTSIWFSTAVAFMQEIWINEVNNKL